MKKYLAFVSVHPSQYSGFVEFDNLEELENKLEKSLNWDMNYPTLNFLSIDNKIIYYSEFFTEDLGTQLIYKEIQRILSDRINYLHHLRDLKDEH